MNTHTNNVDERVFYTYKSEKKAIYVSPISANFGYILPISNQIVSSNTSTVIYGRKPNCEMFIAPISLCKQFSKTFVSYKKYDKKLKEYSNNKHSRSYTDITETKIDHAAKTVTVTANVRIPTFNDLDYKVALILTNFSYVPNASTNTFVKDLIEELSQESKDRNEVYRLLNEVKAEFDKVAPNEVKAFIKLFTY